MTFADYIAQTDPKRMPPFSVAVPQSEYLIYGTEINGYRHIDIVHYMEFSYLVDKEGNVFSTDGQGNPKNGTCFKAIL